MVKEIVQHGHCHNCGRAVKYGERTCGDACQQTFERQQKSRKRTMWIMWGALLVFLLFTLAGPLFGRA